MAQTPEQDQYDADLAAVMALPSSDRRADAKIAFDLKYPNGRPGSIQNVDGKAEALAFGLTDLLIKAFPELQKVYDLFVLKDYTEARLQYFASDYYKNITETGKTRQTLKATARGQYNQLIDAYRIVQQKRLASKGINLDAATFNQLTEEGFDSGLDENQLDIKILNSGKLGTIGGTTLGAVNILKTYADDYGVNQLLNKSWWNQKSMDLFAGKTTDNDIEEEIRNMSASAYAAYAPGIMAGRSLASQTSALKQTYANLYGVDPDTVQYNTKGFMKLLQYVDPKTKQPVPIPIWEAEKVIKSEEDWLFTPTATADFDRVGYNILKDWNLI
jgi:hypothetical protein